MRVRSASSPSLDGATSTTALRYVRGRSGPVPGIGLAWKASGDVSPISTTTIRSSRAGARGGLLLLASALLFLRNLAVLSRGVLLASARPIYALAVHPAQRLPSALWF
jgi:hypothetical protein